MLRCEIRINVSICQSQITTPKLFRNIKTSADKTLAVALPEFRITSTDLESPLLFFSNLGCGLSVSATNKSEPLCCYKTNIDLRSTAQTAVSEQNPILSEFIPTRYTIIKSKEIIFCFKHLAKNFNLPVLSQGVIASSTSFWLCTCCRYHVRDL